MYESAADIGNWEELCGNLDALTSKLSKNRDEFDMHDVEVVTEALSVATSKLKENPVTVSPIVGSCFRLFRIFCVKSSEVQSKIASVNTVFQDTQNVFETLCESQEESSLQCIALAVQFLGNLIVGHSANQAKVWTTFGQFLINLCSHRNEKISNYCTMVVYNLLLNNPAALSSLGEDSIMSLFKLMLRLAVRESDFALCTCMLLLKERNTLESMYNQLEMDNRLLTLDVIHCMITSSYESAEENLNISADAVKFLVQEFKNRSDVILQTSVANVDCLEPMEVARLLELIASASGLLHWLRIFQNDTSLLISCLYLLKSIHCLGKSGDETFSIVQKLSELSLSSRSEATVRKSPMYGFKADLVRLLGNMCWKHRTNQDKVRELDGIPLLLECCNIDARNPFILQWGIMAISNLCKQNRDNQAVIAGMNQEGAVNSSFLLDAGIKLHGGEDGSEILIAPFAP